MEAIIFVLIFLTVIISIISTSNKFNTLQIKIEEAESGIDIALTKRYDTLTKMVEVVKGYAKHEKEVLMEVIKLRKGMSFEEKNKANKKMDKTFEKINILVESYPVIKADKNFATLQDAILEVEEHLQAARRHYNSNVSIYNQKLATFPSIIIAKAKKLTKKDFFEAEDSVKKNVKIEF